MLTSSRKINEAQKQCSDLSLHNKLNEDETCIANVTGGYRQMKEVDCSVLHVKGCWVIPQA